MRRNLMSSIQFEWSNFVGVKHKIKKDHTCNDISSKLRSGNAQILKLLVFTTTTHLAVSMKFLKENSDLEII